jgi:hypothetical protein
MKTDRYTRAVLTVIAACLVWLCIRDLEPIAGASDIVPVRLEGVSPSVTLDVNLEEVDPFVTLNVHVDR